MLLALQGVFIGHLQNALNLRTCIIVGIIGLVIVLILLTEIHTAGEFADADEICPFDKFVFQRTLMQQALKGLDRTDVGKEAQFLTHGKQALLRTNLGCGVIVKFGITYRGKKHSISLLASLESLLGEWVTHLIDGMGTAKGFLVNHFVAELLSNCRHHSHTLLHNLRADTITGQYSNV